VIETERLILREWRASDADPFYAMCNDARVMEFLGPDMSREEVDAAIARQNDILKRSGHCFWALERRADGAFLGFCGIKPGPPETPIETLPEIGWRLAHAHWGRGYAREAATASIRWCWANLADDTVWAITVRQNYRSWGLMERLGMTRCHDLDFNHPMVPDGSPIERHITYSIRRDGGA
jgi:RimJ/RimL family protein N-acetyltransferase